MAVLQAFDKLPALNSAAILLVGSDEALQRQLAEAMLREKKSFAISIHLATTLPLPSERDHLRPRIDLIAFMIDIKSKHSLKNVEASLAYVDARFFLGKVCFLVTGGGIPSYFSSLNVDDGTCKLEGIRAATAQRLLRMLQIFKEKGSISQAQDNKHT